ncbi:MAG TPA: ATP-dependent protease [Candidatus Pelagibacter sp.]|jgi:Lon protease-like protein|nr:ATP-dependent protease [Candidatus Pelagibacter sp.]
MNIKDLPKKISIFPLSNAIFFPKTILPLNIFEERYIKLVEDCMKDQRLFGMVQPKVNKKTKSEVYKVGCLGKVISFNETEDKKYFINLSGVIRFRIKEELKTKKLYREFEVDYSDFINDLKENNNEKNNYAIQNLLDKTKLLFKNKNYLLEWKELEKLNLDLLINTICMITPFSVEEKQLLIETNKVQDKLVILDKIINTNLLDNLENKTIQ